MSHAATLNTSESEPMATVTTSAGYRERIAPSDGAEIIAALARIRSARENGVPPDPTDVKHVQSIAPRTAERITA